MATDGERMTRIETTLEYIKKGMDDNKIDHKAIIKLFTEELNKKANQVDVDKLEKVAWASVGGLITITLGALGFLIKITLFG